MVHYVTQNPASAFARVEFSRAADTQFVFLHLKDAAALPEARRVLESLSVPLNLISTTEHNGKPLLILYSDTPEADIVSSFAQAGVALQKQVLPTRIDPWVIRSILGFGGQTLQLISSFMRPTKKIDPNIFVFAAANLTANGINLVYKAQDADDPHQLRYLKKKENEALTPHLERSGKKPLPVEEAHKTNRKEEQEKQKKGRSLNDFLQRYSVNIGELGLRFIGAFGLAYTLDWKEIAKGKFPKLAASPLRRYAGLSSIAGKSLALTAQIEDPYNPKPHSWLDTFREKYSFLLGGLIEVTSFSALAYDNFTNTNPSNPAQRNRGILFRGKVYRDWLGGIGASMFVLGYVVRSWAKYGQRHVDMDELRAHVSDTIATLPSDQIPDQVAASASRIATHFKDQSGMEFATIYAALAEDLHKHHHLTLHHLHSPHKHAKSLPPSAAHHQAAPAAVLMGGIEHHGQAAKAHKEQYKSTL